MYIQNTKYSQPVASIMRRVLEIEILCNILLLLQDTQDT